MQTEIVPEVEKGAVLSDCGLYRYRLWRRWGSGDRMAWIMLNPSTADADVDDPTIRRCMGFARREGYDGIEVVNLYALRATKPKHLLDHPDPEGYENQWHWSNVLPDPGVGMIVAAWGAGGSTQLRPSLALADWDLAELCVMCLGKTSKGDPRHPLYVRADQPFEALGREMTDG